MVYKVELVICYRKCEDVWRKRLKTWWWRWEGVRRSNRDEHCLWRCSCLSLNKCVLHQYMNFGCKVHCRLEECLNKKSCTWDWFCRLVEIESPCARYLGGVHSCAKPAVLWCKSGLCPHTWYTSSPLQSHPWFTECSPQSGKLSRNLQ